MGSGGAWTRSPVRAERTRCRLLFAGTCTSFRKSSAVCDSLWQSDGSDQADCLRGTVEQLSEYDAVEAAATDYISKSGIYSTNIMRTLRLYSEPFQQLGTSGPDHCCSTSFCNPAALLLGMLVTASSDPTVLNPKMTLKFTWAWSLDKKVDGAISKTFTVSSLMSGNSIPLKRAVWYAWQSWCSVLNCRSLHHLELNN